MLVDSTSTQERVHSEEDIRKMLEYLHDLQVKDPANVRAYALKLQILVSCRRGEVAPLRKSDVYPTGIFISREQLTIRRAGNVPEHWKIVGHTKNGENRIFPMDDHLKEFLQRLCAMLDTYYPGTPYLFPDKTQKNGVINNNVVYRLYRSICKKLGIMFSETSLKGHIPSGKMVLPR